MAIAVLTTLVSLPKLDLGLIVILAGAVVGGGIGTFIAIRMLMVPPQL